MMFEIIKINCLRPAQPPRVAQELSTQGVLDMSCSVFLNS